MAAPATVAPGPLPHGVGNGNGASVSLSASVVASSVKRRAETPVVIQYSVKLPLLS